MGAKQVKTIHDDDVSAVSNALRVASRKFLANAADLDRTQYPQLVDIFIKQSVDCVRIADYLDDPDLP